MRLAPRNQNNCSRLAVLRHVREGPGGTRWVVSIMGGHDKRGRWRVAPHCTVLNIMGGSDIDLNDAELRRRDLRP